MIDRDRIVIFFVLCWGSWSSCSSLSSGCSGLLLLKLFALCLCFCLLFLLFFQSLFLCSSFYSFYFLFLFGHITHDPLLEFSVRFFDLGCAIIAQIGQHVQEASLLARYHLAEFARNAASQVKVDDKLYATELRAYGLNAKHEQKHIGLDILASESLCILVRETIVARA